MQNFKVQIWDGNEELVEVYMFTLLQWKHAMKLEIESGMKMSRGSVISHVRKVLSAPKNFSNEDLLQHIVDSIDNINEQLGVA